MPEQLTEIAVVAYMPLAFRAPGVYVGHAIDTASLYGVRMLFTHAQAIGGVVSRIVVGGFESKTEDVRDFRPLPKCAAGPAAPTEPVSWSTLLVGAGSGRQRFLRWAAEIIGDPDALLLCGTLVELYRRPGQRGLPDGYRPAENELGTRFSGRLNGP